MYLQFLSFLHTDMIQVVEILSLVRQGLIDLLCHLFNDFTINPLTSVEKEMKMSCWHNFYRCLDFSCCFDNFSCSQGWIVCQNKRCVWKLSLKWFLYRHTHWGLKKKADILQIFSNTFSWMSSLVFWFKFHCSEVPIANKSALVQVMTSCWTRRKQLKTWANHNQVLWCRMSSSLGHRESWLGEAKWNIYVLVN